MLLVRQSGLPSGVSHPLRINLGSQRGKMAVARGRTATSVLNHPCPPPPLPASPELGRNPCATTSRAPGVAGINATEGKAAGRRDAAAASL